MNEQIANLEANIKANQMILKALKAEEKKKDSKLFLEGPIALNYLKAVEFCTRPLKRINIEAMEMLKDPKGHIATKLNNQAFKLLEKAKKVENTDLQLANLLAKKLLEIESHYSKYKLTPDPFNTIDILKFQINRIRPSGNNNSLNELETALENI